MAPGGGGAPGGTRPRAAPARQSCSRPASIAARSSSRRTVTLEGERGAVVDGGGKGNVITVAAPDVVIRGLTVRNSGISLAKMNAGIFVGKKATASLIEDNEIDHNLFGIYFWGPEDAVARRNRIVGRRDLRMNERGNGLQLWNTPGSKVLDNDIRYGRDGIFVATSRNNTFARNRFRDLRFAIHYMYTNHSRVVGNNSRGNHAGYVLMFSDHIEVAGNRSRDDRDHGILFNYANHSDVHDNIVVGGDQCAFVYNSNHNRIADNRFEGCNIGIHFTAGSEDNRHLRQCLHREPRPGEICRNALDRTGRRTGAATTGATIRPSTSMATASPTRPIGRTA